jgi:methyl-accepting chemotaxis protein
MSNRVNSSQAFSMKKKLALYFAIIAAVPLILTTVVTSYFSNQAMVEGVFQNNEIVAAGLAREINGMLEAKIRALTIAAASPEMQSMDTARQMPLLRSIASQFSDMTNIIVADTKGTQTVRTIGKLANIADRSYFKEVAGGANVSISEVLVTKGTGQVSTIIAVPIRDGSGFRGVLIGAVDLAHLSDFVTKTKLGLSGYAFIVDKEGKAVAHPDQQLVKDLADLSTLAPVKAAIAGQAGVTVYEFKGSDRLAGYSFVPLSRWGVVAQQPMAEAMAGATKVRTTGMVFTLVSILLAILAGMYVAGRLTSPLRHMVDATEKLAAGDLTVKVNVASRDEIGQLAQAFNNMVDNLQRLIRGVIGTADQVAASAQQLSATSSEAERAITQIANTISEFAQGANNQTQEVEKTLGIVDSLTKASAAVANQAGAAAGLSDEMSRAAETGSGAAENAVATMSELKEVTNATTEVVTGLGEKSQQIGQILDVISEIAGQTNLLALNAAIEAARAGEQGRGFAVVAEEVRKLAEQSQEAAQQISQIVREIQAQTEQAITAMTSGNEKVGVGVSVVQTAGESLQDIAEKIKSSVGMITAINNAAKEQVAGMKTMVGSTEHVAVIARQSSANAETTAAASEEVTASMEEISGASQALATIASELQTLVAKFRI